MPSFCANLVLSGRASVFSGRCVKDMRNIKERFCPTTDWIERGVENARTTTCRQDFQYLFTRRLIDGPVVVRESGSIGGRGFSGRKNGERLMALAHSPRCKTGLLLLDAVEEMRQKVGG